MKHRLNVSLFLLTILLMAIACGGGDSDPNNEVATISVSGEINETGQNLKPRSAAGSSEHLVGVIDYVNENIQDENFEFSGTSLSFSFTAFASQDFIIKIYSASDLTRVYMSRFISARTSEISGNDGQLNAITTEHATELSFISAIIQMTLHL